MMEGPRFLSHFAMTNSSLFRSWRRRASWWGSRFGLDRFLGKCWRSSARNCLVRWTVASSIWSCRGIQVVRMCSLGLYSVLSGAASCRKKALIKVSLRKRVQVSSSFHVVVGWRGINFRLRPSRQRRFLGACKVVVR